ncbi:hypothetical protein Tco_0563956 [Tanacetum coccineum]
MKEHLYLLQERNLPQVGALINSPSESPTPTHVAIPPKLRIIISVKLEPEELPPQQTPPHSSHISNTDNWPSSSSNMSPPPRFAHPPLRFKHPPSPQPLFVNIKNNAPQQEHLPNLPPNLGNQQLPNPHNNILDFDYGVTWTLDYAITSFKPARWKVHISSLRRKPLKDHGFVGYPFDYHVTLGFGSIVGGLDHVNLVIRLPLEHRISRILGKVDHFNPRVDINTLTMEQYLALSRENQAPDVVKPEIGGNVNIEIKTQFMRELREDTFSRNKNEDSHDHVDRVLNIVSLFNIPKVSQDVVLLCVFPFTLTGSTKRWVDRLTPGVVNTWDLLKKAFI